jgi:hypothetical protein
VGNASANQIEDEDDVEDEHDVNAERQTPNAKR